MQGREPPDLVGAAEIAEMLGGISRQRVTQLTKHAEFPPPALRLRMGALWWADEVRQWAADHRPPARE